jgi:hypothetical protein
VSTKPAAGHEDFFRPPIDLGRIGVFQPRFGELFCGLHGCPTNDDLLLNQI